LANDFVGLFGDLFPGESQDSPASQNEQILARAIIFERSIVRVVGTPVDLYTQPQSGSSKICLSDYVPVNGYGVIRDPTNPSSLLQQRPRSSLRF
jgi:hypothetical protein